MSGMLHRPGVIELLARQHWIASVSQLAELGVSRQSVAAAVRSGLVVRPMHGVVGIRTQCETFEARCAMLNLLAPVGSFLSATTAGRLYGLRRMPDLPVELTVHERHRVAAPAWARIVETSWLDDEPRPQRDDGLVVASPLRILFGLAAQLPERAFQTAAEDAWHRQLLTPGDAAAYLAAVRRGGRTGVARLEAWLERVGGINRPATTGLEQLLIDLALSAGLPEPVRQHPLRLPSGTEIHLDIAWPDIRFAIEPGHSWWHGGDLAQRRDQERDRACSEVGWHVVRFDESVWENRRQTVRQIRSMYRARARDVA